MENLLSGKLDETIVVFESVSLSLHIYYLIIRRIRTMHHDVLYCL
jgi:hypothetical protein